MRTRQTSARPSLQKQASVSVHLCGTLRHEQTHPARGSGCTLDHLHPPKMTKKKKRDDVTITGSQRGCWFHHTSQTRFHIPLKSVFTFGPEEVHVGFKLEFEDVLLVDAVRLLGGADGVAKQRQARQREVVLQRRCVWR